MFLDEDSAGIYTLVAFVLKWNIFIEQNLELKYNIPKIHLKIQVCKEYPKRILHIYSSPCQTLVWVPVLVRECYVFNYNTSEKCPLLKTPILRPAYLPICYTYYP